jgi:FdrA protein
MEKTKLEEFLSSPMHVVNVGLEAFADELNAQGVSVVHVDWSPPAGGDPELAGLLSKLGA